MSPASRQSPEPPSAPRALTDADWAEVARELGRPSTPSEAVEGGEAEMMKRRGPFRPGRLVPIRSRLDGKGLSRLFRAVDAGGVVAVAVLTAHMATLGGFLSATVGAVAPFVLGALLLMWSLMTFQAYRFGHREGILGHLARVSAAFGLTGALLLAAIMPLPDRAATLQTVSQWFALTFASLILSHAAWWMMVRRWRAVGRLTPNVVIVGATPAAEKLIRTALETREVNILGVFEDRLSRAPKSIEGVPVLGDTGALIGHKIMPYVDRVVITVNPAAQSRVRELIDRLSILPNEINLVVEAEDALPRLADAPLSRVSGEPEDLRRAMVKRVQDLAVGVLALALSTPIMALIALAVRMDSPGPVFFRQRRHGFNNEEILVWKFRSMRQEAADHAATKQVSADDDRVTKVGRFIRRTSLDELPQLFNVLKGEMSLVGPRPHAIGMKTGQTESARLVAEYAHRHRMKPGMTGWAAIHGSRGPVDTPELVKRRVALDIEYIERQSFWLDLYIMAMTIPCLLGDSDQVR